MSFENIKICLIKVSSVLQINTDEGDPINITLIDGTLNVSLTSI